MKCQECQMPQPEHKRFTLHMEECSKHDIATCHACRNLIEKEDFEELERVKTNEH